MSTIYDIAKKTGYSPSTVSKALNDYDNISQKSKEKILTVAKELNYVPNASARGLMTRKSFLIGLLIFEEDKETILHSHLAGIIGSFKNYVESKGYDLLFVNTYKNNDSLTYYERCKYRSLDGVLLAMDYSEEIQELVKSDLPVVSVESIYENRTTVLCDNYNGALKALDYLYFLGHRKITFINADFANPNSNDRFLAYNDFVKDKKDVDFKIYKAEGFKKRHGIHIAKEILKDGFSNLPTAFFCISDEIAIGVMEYMETKGINVPDDISFVGFDDIKVAEYVGLTTIRQNRKLIGELAGEKLISEIEGSKNFGLVKTDTELVIRNTCKSIK